MDTESAIELVEILFDYQYDMIWLRRGAWGMNHVEFLFVETSRVIVAHPELKDWIVRAIEFSIREGYERNGGARPRPRGFILEEFVLFFVHYTRWPEFNSLATRVRGTPADLWRSNLVSRWSEQIDAALRDDWEDKMFFECFSGEPSTHH